MSKKKEQVKHLKKSFAAVIKAFEKEKDKKKRKEAFEFLTGRIAEFGQFTGGGSLAEVPASGDNSAETPPAAHVVPSPGLVEEIRTAHLYKKN